MKEWAEAILKAINSLGNEASLQEVYSALERYFPLTKENLRLTTHGDRPAFQNQVRSLVSNLVEAGDLERVGRGRYRLTPQGLDRLQDWLRNDGRALQEPKAAYSATTSHQYLIDVEVESLEEGGYMAVCRAIQGCRAEGDTVAEALENIEDVARMLLELRREDGLPFPEGLKPYRPGLPIKADLVVTTSD